MKIGLRDIEYFLAVAEHGHVGRAAEALGLTQPAISRSLRRLEQAMDTTLVSRTPKGVALTAVGSSFLSRVRELQLSVDDITREVEDLTRGRAGELRVGANSIAVDHLLPAAMSKLLEVAPRLAVKVTVGSNDTLIPLLQSGRLEIVVSGAIAGEKKFSTVHLWDDTYHVYAGPLHRLAKRKRLHLADVAEERWAMPPDAPPTLWLRRTFSDNGFSSPNVMLETTSLSLRLSVMESSNMLDFLPEIVAADAVAAGSIVKLPVRELCWSRPLAAAYRAGSYMSPAAKFFIQILKTSATHKR